MTHKIRGVDVEKFAYYVNKLRQNVGLETWKRRQIVTSQTAHTKHKWQPRDPESNPPNENLADKEKEEVLEDSKTEKTKPNQLLEELKTLVKADITEIG